jgi:hypothetical protein
MTKYKSKKGNLVYLLRNKENILRNYVKIDDKILESIIEENHEKFNQLVGEKSTDGFLKEVMPNYNEFSIEFFELIKQEHATQIEDLQKKKNLPQPQIRTSDYENQKPMKKEKELTSEKLTKAEKNKISILKKSGYNDQYIIRQINTERTKKGQVEVKNKVVKKQIKKVK